MTWKTHVTAVQVAEFDTARLITPQTPHLNASVGSFSLTICDTCTVPVTSIYQGIVTQALLNPYKARCDQGYGRCAYE